MKIAIVSSMFNEEIANNLISGALQCYKDIIKDDFNQSNISKVPGAFEIPFIVKNILEKSSDRFDAIITSKAAIVCTRNLGS